MNRISLWWVSALLVGLLLACQKEEPVAGSRWVLRVKLPASLDKEKARHLRFLSRVTHLELNIKSKDGLVHQHSFPPGQWADIRLPALDFPRSQTDLLTVHVRVWDRRRDGSARDTPVLTGKKDVSAKEAASSGAEVTIRLALQVSEKEYD